MDPKPNSRIFFVFQSRNIYVKVVNQCFQNAKTKYFAAPPWVTTSVEHHIKLVIKNLSKLVQTTLQNSNHIRRKPSSECNWVEMFLDSYDFRVDFFIVVDSGLW